MVIYLDHHAATPVSPTVADAMAKAREAGADIAFNAVEDPKAYDPFLADKGRFDILFECSGNASALTKFFPSF